MTFYMKELIICWNQSLSSLVVADQSDMAVIWKIIQETVHGK
ncbi:hypothetical protein SAMN04487931_1078 [Desulfobacula phenolica]|uniref:Uncharacterized protein n=1 Tax=Desulfobacula phenolica TaxID=90732 RepID=A0A1H2HS48_9BACT|nr:hypothetical protein SAMN04487931_1078 [Desulfobacula phenolica]